MYQIKHEKMLRALTSIWLGKWEIISGISYMSHARSAAFLPCGLERRCGLLFTKTAFLKKFAHACPIWMTTFHRKTDTHKIYLTTISNWFIEGQCEYFDRELCNPYEKTTMLSWPRSCTVLNKEVFDNRFSHYLYIKHSKHLDMDLIIFNYWKKA